MVEKDKFSNNNKDNILNNFNKPFKYFNLGIDLNKKVNEDIKSTSKLCTGFIIIIC